MDFFKEITTDSIIKDYLKDFPENDWKAVVKKTLLYGIQSLKALENLGFTSPKLEKIPALHSELSDMKKLSQRSESSQHLDLKDSKRKNNAKENKPNPRVRGISQKVNRDKAKSRTAVFPRGNSKDTIKQPPFKLTGKEKPETRRKLPKYLQNIDSKIKEEVTKSKKGIFSSSSHIRIERREEDREELKKDLDNFEKAKENEGNNSQRSSSSFSTYNAADDVKEFYQREFSKLMSFSGGQRRRPVKVAKKGERPMQLSPTDSDR